MSLFEYVFDIPVPVCARILRGSTAGRKGIFFELKFMRKNTWICATSVCNFLAKHTSFWTDIMWYGCNLLKQVFECFCNLFRLFGFDFLVGLNFLHYVCWIWLSLSVFDFLVRSNFLKHAFRKLHLCAAVWGTLFSKRGVVSQKGLVF